MTNEEFREICRTASRSLRADDVDALSNGDDLFIDGVKVGAFYEEDQDEAVHCYVDLGSFENAMNRDILLRSALEINLELDARMGESFGVERESGHLVLRSCFEADSSFTAEVLVERLQGYSAFAQELYGDVFAQLERPSVEG